MDLQGLNVLITGASMGIGMSIARAVAAKGGNLILLSRTKSKLVDLKRTINQDFPNIAVEYIVVDIQNYEEVHAAVESAVGSFGKIDILVNNAGIALGVPLPFHQLPVAQILEMNNTNINGTMFVTHAVLNVSMIPRKAGTILTITSASGIEVPPYPGKTVYHANKVCQEGFSNALRNELSGTDIKVLVLRPGGVDTEFHAKGFGGEDSKEKVDKLLGGWTPLQAAEVADAAIYMLMQPVNVSVKAMDVYPTAQRSLSVFDRSWNERREKDKNIGQAEE